MKVLLDSVILIDHFNGHAAASNYLRRVAEEAVVSVISRAELLAGFDGAEERHVAVRLLDRFPTLGLDRDIADLAAALRRTHRWRLPDAFQAALAQHHRVKLATRNRRDFPPDRCDFVVVPYSL